MKYLVYCVTVLCSLSNVDGVRGDNFGLGLRGGGHLHLAGLQPLLGTLAVSYLQKLYYTRVFLELYLNTWTRKYYPLLHIFIQIRILSSYGQDPGSIDHRLSRVRVSRWPRRHYDGENNSYLVTTLAISC